MGTALPKLMINLDHVHRPDCPGSRWLRRLGVGLLAVVSLQLGGAAINAVQQPGAVHRTAVVGVSVPVAQAQRDFVTDGTVNTRLGPPVPPKNTNNWITRSIKWLMYEVLVFFSNMTLMVINFMTALFQYNGFTTEPIVQTGWVLVRDVCNMFFIFALLLIAFGTILRIPSYQYRTSLFHVILMAILINLSKSITGFLIDISQIVMLSFVSAFNNIAGSSLAEALGMDRIFILEQKQNASSGAFTEAAGEEIVATAGTLTASFILAAIMMFIMFVVILAMAATLLIRIIKLWILVILSPLAFMASVLKPLGGAQRWWGEFTKELIAGPVLAFFLWLVLATAQQTGSLTQQCQTEPENSSFSCDYNPTNLAAGNFTNLVNFSIVIGLLMAGLGIAKSAGGAGVGKVADWGAAMLRGGAARAKRVSKYVGKRVAERSTIAPTARAVGQQLQGSWLKHIPGVNPEHTKRMDIERQDRTFRWTGQKAKSQMLLTREGQKYARDMQEKGMTASTIEGGKLIDKAKAGSLEHRALMHINVDSKAYHGHPEKIQKDAKSDRELEREIRTKSLAGGDKLAMLGWEDDPNKKANVREQIGKISEKTKGNELYQQLNGADLVDDAMLDKDGQGVKGYALEERLDALIDRFGELREDQQQKVVDALNLLSQQQTSGGQPIANQGTYQSHLSRVRALAGQKTADGKPIVKKEEILDRENLNSRYQQMARKQTGKQYDEQADAALRHIGMYQTPTPEYGAMEGIMAQIPADQLAPIVAELREASRAIMDASADTDMRAGYGRYTRAMENLEQAFTKAQPTRVVDKQTGQTLTNEEVFSRTIGRGPAVQPAAKVGSDEQVKLSRLARDAAGLAQSALLATPDLAKARVIQQKARPKVEAKYAQAEDEQRGTKERNQALQAALVFHKNMLRSAGQDAGIRVSYDQLNVTRFNVDKTIEAVKPLAQEFMKAEAQLNQAYADAKRGVEFSKERIEELKQLLNRLQQLT